MQIKAEIGNPMSKHLSNRVDGFFKRPESRDLVAESYKKQGFENFERNKNEARIKDLEDGVGSEILLSERSEREEMLRVQ